tara:strand:+ start:378 stop:890 length:513 start_codon:yes stop_codon:yes gene_type:complete
MKTILLFFLFIPIVSFAQDLNTNDNQLKPFVGYWKSSTKTYRTNIQVTHEPNFPMNKLVSSSDKTTEVLFFDFYYFNKIDKKEIKIKSSLEENPRSFTAFLSDDAMPNVLLIFDDQGYKYKLKSIDENKIELFSNEKPRYEVNIDTKESQIIPKEPSPIPDRIIFKRTKK